MSAGLSNRMQGDVRPDKGPSPKSWLMKIQTGDQTCKRGVPLCSCAVTPLVTVLELGYGGWYGAPSRVSDHTHFGNEPRVL